VAYVQIGQERARWLAFLNTATERRHQ